MTSRDVSRRFERELACGIYKNMFEDDCFNFDTMYKKYLVIPTNKIASPSKTIDEKRINN